MKHETGTLIRQMRHTLVLTVLLFMGVPGLLQAADKVYTVKENDTLSHIAESFGVKTSDLIAHNKIQRPDRIKPGLKLQIPPRPGDPTEYKVKKGDTLVKIAQKHGVSLSTLIAYNGITRPDRLSIGQELKIPTARSELAVYPTLDPTVRRQIDRIKIRRKWKYIVIHHSGADAGTMKGMDEYHRQKRRMKNGLAYHFVIGNGNGIPEGKIEIADRWKRQIQGGHLASESLNHKSIGICLVGNFDKEKPSQKELTQLEALVRYLMKKCGISATGVKTHQQINTKPTRCPGSHFPTRSFMLRL